MWNLAMITEYSSREEYTFNENDHLVIAGDRLNFNKLIAKQL